MELEDIDQERLDIDVFGVFFLLIRPRDLHYTDTSLLSKRWLISTGILTALKFLEFLLFFQSP